MAAAAQRRPNILLITADQWRGDHLGVAGHPVLKTPTLDALAGEGVRFSRHFAQASPCGPSRASLLTGLYMFNHRSVANGTPLDRRHATLATEARRAGYRPVLFGYTDTTPDPRDLSPNDPRLTTYEGVLNGFDAVAPLVEDPRPWLAWLVRNGHLDAAAARYPAIYDNRTDLIDDAQGKGSTYAPTIYPPEASDTAYVTERAIDWLRVEAAGAPWLMHVSYFRPHPPWSAPAPYHALYDADEMPAPIGGNAAAEHPLDQWFIENESRRAFFRTDVFKPASASGPLETAQARATYCGLMTELDDNLARLFQEMRSLGLWEETLVVFTSDHGEQLGDRLRFGKRGHHDACFHVPLIVKPAGGIWPQVVDAVTEAVDVTPTLIEAMGAEPPPAMDGRVLTPWLEGRRPADWREAAVFEYDFREKPAAVQALGLTPDRAHLTVWRGERWKYVAFDGLPPLLFDLEEDPDCLVDRAADPACQPARLECAEALHAHRARHADRALANMLATADGIREWRGPR